MKRLYNWLHKYFHIWKYDRPYHRTCLICGISQCWYVHSWDYWAFKNNNSNEIATDKDGNELCYQNNDKHGWWE